VVSHLLTGPEGDLEIGDDVVIGHGAAISCFSQMRIGNGAHLGPFAVVSDSDFHVVGDRNAAPVPRPVDIGSGVRIGARVTILPGSRIGDGAVVAAGSTVAGVIAPGAIVAGVPARAVRDPAATNATAMDGSWEDAVRALVQRTLGLSTLPLLDQGPGELPQWDSLGALRLLLGLEEELGIRLSEKEMVGVKRVADLVAFVSERASAAGG
jgi:serine acetyltransferase